MEMSKGSVLSTVNYILLLGICLIFTGQEH
jgi:hypothetical protein